MASASAVLKKMVPELIVSKRKLRVAEACCQVRLNREEGNQNLGFSSRPFVLCGLPVKRPAPTDLLYERRNGNFLLQITGHPSFGCPRVSADRDTQFRVEYRSVLPTLTQTIGRLRRALSKATAHG
jgi:hypothetical protein